MSQEKIIDAHNYLTQLVQMTKRSFVEIGSVLYTLKKDGRYKEVSGVDSWVAYLEQPEISLTKREANRLIDIYRTFCVKLGFDKDRISEVPVKNIHYLLPLVRDKDKQEVEPMLDDALHLSQKDFKERAYDYKSGDNPTRTYTYMVMKKCVETGNLGKVHGIESDQIINAFNINEEGYV